MNIRVQSIINYYLVSVNALLTILSPLVNITGRTYVAWAFFLSGLTKIRDWESTLMLFEYEYMVPVLSFQIAAFLATFGELVFPILLIVGLATRFNALGLSVINVVAVISLEEIAPVALYGHVIWGVILFHIVLVGGEKLSVDYFIKKKIVNKEVIIKDS